MAGAAPKYPDLQTAPPSDIHLSWAQVGEEHHYVVRFSNLVNNVGAGTFELHGVPHFPIDGLFEASQWIYDDTAGVSMQAVGTFAFHPSHQHFHFDGFARYELWRQADFQKAADNGFKTGKALYTSPKVSFCVMDFYHTDPATGPPRAVYSTCSPAMEGISQGWGDLYDYLLPEQWVDVGQRPLPDGSYVVRSIADPFNLIYESPVKADASVESQVANSASTSFKVVNGRSVTGP
jgi:hypothetical protein